MGATLYSYPMRGNGQHTATEGGPMAWSGRIFRITSVSFPPVYPGTLPANRDPGHYDPVWPPNGVTLERWYDWWLLEFSSDDYVLTPFTYRHEVGEHNGAFGAATHAWVVWADNRRSSVRSAHFSQRHQSDVRMARIPWSVP